VNVSEDFEIKISKRRFISIPKTIAEALGIEGGAKVKLYVEEGKIVIEPIKDALWFALHDPKVGRVTFNELEEESEREQEKLLDAL
jgi:AbrB family looped-hinge helix DNA binding protein